MPTLNTFLLCSLNGKAFPELGTEEIEGKLKVSWKGKGKAVLWTAHSPTRDFRQSTWTSTTLKGEERVLVSPKVPKSGWSASYVTVTFPALRTVDADFKVSTPITVLPTKFAEE